MFDSLILPAGHAVSIATPHRSERISQGVGDKSGMLDGPVSGQMFSHSVAAQQLYEAAQLFVSMDEEFKDVEALTGYSPAQSEIRMRLPL